MAPWNSIETASNVTFITTFIEKCVISLILHWWKIYNKINVVMSLKVDEIEWNKSKFLLEIKSDEKKRQKICLYHMSPFFKYGCLYGQRHAKRDHRTYAKSVDPDQPPSLRRRVWSGSVLFDTRHINGTYISCCVNSLITYWCYQHCFGGWSWSTLCEMSECPFSRDAGHIVFTYYQYS